MVFNLGVFQTSSSRPLNSIELETVVQSFSSLVSNRRQLSLDLLLVLIALYNIAVDPQHAISLSLISQAMVQYHSFTVLDRYLFIDIL